MSDKTPDQIDRGPSLRRMMLIDTLIGVLVNAGVFPLILWLVRLPPPVGPGEGFADAIKATALPVALMTFIMTLVLRARFSKTPASAADLVGPSSPSADARAGRLVTFVHATALRLGSPSTVETQPKGALSAAGLGEAPLPSPVLWALGRPVAPVLPQSSRPRRLGGVLLRTAFFTLLAVMVLAPLRVAACAALGVYPLSTPGFMLLNVIHGAIIGTLFMPPIILAAMGDKTSPAG